jgi:di/tricarboxylate transporter
MSLISLILALAICGFLAWLVLQIPVPVPVRNIIVAVICVFLVIWILQQFGVNTGLPTLRLK